eukprot:g72365.t1
MLDKRSFLSPIDDCFYFNTKRLVPDFFSKRDIWTRKHTRKFKRFTTMDDLIFNMDDEFSPATGGSPREHNEDLRSGATYSSPKESSRRLGGLNGELARDPNDDADMDMDAKLGTSVAQVEIMLSNSPTTQEYPFLEMRLSSQDQEQVKPATSYPRPRDKAPNLDFLNGEEGGQPVESAAKSAAPGGQEPRSQLSRQMEELRLNAGKKQDNPPAQVNGAGKHSTPKSSSRTLGTSVPMEEGEREIRADEQQPALGLGGSAFDKIRSPQQQTKPVGGLASALAKQRMGAPPGNSKKVIRIGVDDFALLKVIGRGAYGKVFLVKKKATGVLYAMKVLRKKDIIQKKVVGHTKSERSVLETIQHPFFVQLRYAFQTPSKLYLILDYVPGGELFTRLDEEVEFSEQVAAFYAAEVVLALEHLHALNIIYRDLKPENILLDREGHIRLTDFGFAKADIKSNHESTTFCGTIHYMAPEIITNSGHGKAADWWALGVLIYEMVTGKTPFYASNRKGIQKKILNAPLKFPKWMTNYCQHLIKELLQRPVQKRMGTRAGVEEIKRHQFFRTIDWVKLAKKEVEAPFKPTFTDKLDTSHFDEEFTSERPVDSPAASPSPSLLRGGASQLSSTPLFNGFSYYGSPNIGGHSIGSRNLGGSPMKPGVGGGGTRTPLGNSLGMFPLPQLGGGNGQSHDDLSNLPNSPLGNDFEAFMPNSYASARRGAQQGAYRYLFNILSSLVQDAFTNSCARILWRFVDQLSCGWAGKGR